MSLPFEYDSVTPGEFGGAKPTATDFESARVVILPVPLDRTTSYVPGTRLGPHEILVASSHMELWDEETETDVHSIGIYTLPELELPFAGMDEVIQEIRRVAAELVNRGKFPVVLGGEHSITAPVVAAVAEKHPGLSVLQIDAHADLRDSFMGTPHNHACAMRRVLEYARCTQVGIRSLSPEEAAAAPDAADRDFLRLQHAPARRLDRSRRRLAERDGLHHDRLRRIRPGDHAGGGDAGAGRAVVVRDAGAAAPRHRHAPRRRLRHRRAVSDAGQRRAELPLREADLQDPVVPLRQPKSPGAR